MSTFKELGVNKQLVKGLNELNIKTPTEIQAEVIPLLLNNTTDFVGQAQTGTGKTAAYSLPLLHRINSKKAEVQALILCPTRDLGQQIAKQIFLFTKHTDKVFTEGVFGGMNIDQQIKALQRPTQIVVATPGRLADLIGRNAIDISKVKTIILDEADEMLTMGFKKELDKILSKASAVQCKWLFSATMPHGIQQMVKQHLSANAIKREVESKKVVNKNIEHQYVRCEVQEKFGILLEFLKWQKSGRGIVFCRTKAGAQGVEKQLKEKGISAGAIHGDLQQRDRETVMRSFKKRRTQVLVATDIAARGIDVENLSYVVHYKLPEKDEYYTHRSGRTARAGQRGISICLVSSADMKQLRNFEKKLGIAFREVK